LIRQPQSFDDHGFLPGKSGTGPARRGLNAMIIAAEEQDRCTLEHRPGPTGRDERGDMPGSDDYEYAPLRLDPTVSGASASTMLTIHAEYSGWELARVLKFPDGTRRVWLRRRRRPGLAPAPAI
jgi:hypothetical protein